MEKAAEGWQQHELMRDAILGDSSPLWEMDPEVARVLFCSWVSGSEQVVIARSSIQESMLDNGCCQQPVELVPSTVVHIDSQSACPPLSSNEVYVGSGVPGCQYFVPSIWSNPFDSFDLVSTDGEIVSFQDYVESRVDWESWLSPLVGKTLVCSCDKGQGECHAEVLLAGVSVLLQNKLEEEKEEEEEEMPALLDEDVSDEEDEQETDHKVVDKRTLWAANETMGKRTSKVDAKPSWPASWHWLVAQIRAATTLIFWEIFAGCAELTKQFAASGWETGPPVDFLWDPSWDVFHPEFLALLLGILFERRVRILHLGTPCSSFSMAFNRFPSHAIRDAAHPEGFPNLGEKQREMVETGNMLVYVGIALLKAQQKLGMIWTWEQPASSLQLLFPALVEVFSEFAVAYALSHICAYGAPWIKPTMVVSNSKAIMGLSGRCSRDHEHIRIEGKAPCGNNWSKIASAYWPEWARCFALLFEFLKGQPRVQSGSRQSGWLTSNSVSIQSVLSQSGFSPSGRRSAETVATRVAALTQPTGAALPQQLPDGLSTDAHLEVALSTCHPFQRPVTVDPGMQRAVRRQGRKQTLIRDRLSTLEAVEALSEALKDEEKTFRAHIHEELKPIVAKRSLCLARELQYICRCQDYTFVPDYAIGKPMLGWTRRAHGQRQRATDPDISLQNFFEWGEENNSEMVARAASSGDLDLDAAVDAKVKEEVKIEALKGPYLSVKQLQRHNPESDRAYVVPRHGIWEQHGGQQEPTCRLIDDMLISGHNACAGTEHTHVPADVDTVVSQTRVVQEAFPDAGLSCFTSDFRKAYKQDSLSPSQMFWVIIAVWSHEHQRPLFWMPRTQLFGSRVSPVNFSRIPIWSYGLMAALFAVAMSSCVDDVICVERMSTIQSAFICWRRVCWLLGWDVPDSKSPPPQRALRVLGIWLDLSKTPWEPFFVLITQDRLEKILDFINSILECGQLAPGEASSLYGQLGWTCITSHGRCGRAKLRPIGRRARENKMFMNVQLQAALRWWSRFLLDYRPRSFDSNVRQARHVISYSDGEGSEEGGVGAALWYSRDRPPLAGFLKVPSAIRKLWRVQKERVYRDIFELEAVAPLLILEHWGEEFMADCLWTHYIDNDGSLAALVRGSSSVLAGDCIVGRTWHICSQLRIAPWFERVESKSNPLDGLSRGRQQGSWRSVQRFRISDVLLKLLSEAGFD